MKFLFDLFPVLLFFIAYKLSDIYTATAVAIAASIAQVGFLWLRHRRFETMHLVTLGLIVVLGGATLYLQDERFIKWKPTLVNWLFAALFIATLWFGDRPLPQRMMGAQVTLPDAVWRRLTWAWAAFFSAAGLLNLYVAYAFSTEAWVNFKLFGLFGLMLLFAVAQTLWLARYLKE